MNTYWVIWVGGGYGAFLFKGRELEAEEMRVYKARQEQAVARKRLASDVEISTGVANNCANHPLFKGRYRYHCECVNCRKAGEE